MVTWFGTALRSLWSRATLTAHAAWVMIYLRVITVDYDFLNPWKSLGKLVQNFVQETMMHLIEMRMLRTSVVNKGCGVVRAFWGFIDSYSQFMTDSSPSQTSLYGLLQTYFFLVLFLSSGRCSPYFIFHIKTNRFEGQSIPWELFQEKQLSQVAV